jgi:hypothetical protein
MSAAATLLVLLILAMGAVLIVVFFVMPFFAFDLDLDGELKTRRPQSRIRSGRSAKRTRKKSENFLKRRSSLSGSIGISDQPETAA